MEDQLQDHLTDPGLGREMSLSQVTDSNGPRQEESKAGPKSSVRQSS